MTGLLTAITLVLGLSGLCAIILLIIIGMRRAGKGIQESLNVRRRKREDEKRRLFINDFGQIRKSKYEFCIHCGTEIKKDSKFCGQCGGVLPDSNLTMKETRGLSNGRTLKEASEKSSVEQTARDERWKVNSRHSGVFFIIGLLFVIVVVGGIASPSSGVIPFVIIIAVISAILFDKADTSFDTPSSKERLVALILCFLFGSFGAHRIYIGKYLSAFAIFFAGFVFGVVLAKRYGVSDFYIALLPLIVITIVADFVLILIGKFRDKEGYPLLKWTSRN